MKAVAVPALAGIVALAMGLMLVSSASCDGQPEPGQHPPRCEPASELQVERGLKRGYRALADSDEAVARAAFKAVLKLDPGHPQAREGLRRLDESPRERSLGAPRQPAAGGDQGGIIVAGRTRRVGLAVNSERMRFEEQRARRVARQTLGITVGAASNWYGQRALTAGGDDKLEASDAQGLEGIVDLVVLHDSRSVDTRTGFVTLVENGASTHFSVDYDGTVYQTLDLAYEASHADSLELDRRSISIDLVNPVSRTQAPLPDGVDEPERPLSQEILLQGERRVHYGYTAPQMNSLVKLVQALGAMFPRLRLVVPRLGDDIPRARLPRARVETITGVVGHVHLSGKATDPGAGFDWETFEQRLRRPLSGPPARSP